MLKINNVSKSFAGLIAVDQCSFAIREGTISALIGPNGAGKSTLFNCISRIYPVDSGEIYYADNRLDLLPPHKIARLGIGRRSEVIPSRRAVVTTRSRPTRSVMRTATVLSERANA